jgi:hypothetical protein
MKQKRNFALILSSREISKIFRTHVLDRSSGFGLPTYPPSHYGITHNSGICFTGFRSLHGCGAAEDFNLSSLTSSHRNQKSMNVPPTSFQRVIT